jgi:hypothetical protein
MILINFLRSFLWKQKSIPNTVVHQQNKQLLGLIVARVLTEEKVYFQ